MPPNATLPFDRSSNPARRHVGISGVCPAFQGCFRVEATSSSERFIKTGAGQGGSVLDALPIARFSNHVGWRCRLVEVSRIRPDQRTVDTNSLDPGYLPRNYPRLNLEWINSGLLRALAKGSQIQSAGASGDRFFTSGTRVGAYARSIHGRVVEGTVLERNGLRWRDWAAGINRGLGCVCIGLLGVRHSARGFRGNCRRGLRCRLLVEWFNSSDVYGARGYASANPALCLSCRPKRGARRDRSQTVYKMSRLQYAPESPTGKTRCQRVVFLSPLSHATHEFR